MAYDKHTSDRLLASDRRKMRSTDFGIPETREFPMPDAPHVRAAEAYFRIRMRLEGLASAMAAEKMTPEEKKALLAHRILIKARKYGVHVRSEEILEWASKYSK